MKSDLLKMKKKNIVTGNFLGLIIYQGLRPKQTIEFHN